MAMTRAERMEKYQDGLMRDWTARIVGIKGVPKD